MYNTGARVSEILAVKRSDLQLKPPGNLQLLGKGRKERAVPLWKRTVSHLQHWLTEAPMSPTSPVFVNRHGQRLSRSTVEYRLELAVQRAIPRCLSLKGRSISPHTIRHTTAMHLLQAGVDINVIAMWLGHESPTTTHGYIELDLVMKRKTLEKLKQPELGRRNKQLPDSLIAFLESL
jgi:site-specific recombinase XerD